MLPTLPGVMARLWWLQLLILVTAAVALPHDSPGGFPSPLSGGEQRQMYRAEVEQKPSGRGTRCAPREDLRSDLQHQYSSAQVGGIVQHIKQRLDHLRIPDIDKLRKSKGSSRPTSHQQSSKQPKSKVMKNNRY